MRSKDITLSASLIGLYIAVTIISSISPIKIKGIMISALFGVFWPFFSTKINLMLQAFRLSWSMIKLVKSAPKLLNMFNIESIISLQLIEWLNQTLPGIISKKETELLVVTGQIKATPQFWVIMFCYGLLYCFITPYLFYKYFKYVGVFRRLPSF